MKKEKKILVYYHPIFITAVYILLHILIRLSFSETLQVDDREQILAAQNLSLGYMMPQPPLYSWLAWFFFKIFGSNLFALTLLKYSLIFITFGYIWGISKRLFKNTTIQKLAFYSFFLMPSFFWHMHQGFTHTILLGLGIVSSFYYMLILKKTRTKLNYFFLGLSISTGLLAKYSFPLFILPIFISLFSVKSFRRVVFNKGFFISLITILLITSPHFSWLIHNFHLIAAQAETRLAISMPENASPLFTTIEIFKSFLGFITPLFILMLPIFIKKEIYKYNIRESYLLLRNFYLLIFLCVLVFSLVYEIVHIKVRWLHPIMMIIPFLLWIMAEGKIKLEKKFLKIFFISTFLLSLLVIVVRVLQVTYAPIYGYDGRLNIPITQTLQKIPQNLYNESILISKNYDIVAHLISIFPENQIIYGNDKFNDFGQDAKHCLEIENKPIKQHKDSLIFGEVYSEINQEKLYKIYYHYRKNQNCY